MLGRLVAFAKSAARLALVVTLVVGAACSRRGLHIAGRDAGTRSSDAVPDLPVEQSPAVQDMAERETENAECDLAGRLDAAQGSNEWNAAERYETSDNPDERGSQDRYALSVDVQVAPHLQGTNLSMLRRPGTTSLS
jgi:hypothetical protein